jgi:putative FmdB family regulatory protein
MPLYEYRCLQCGPSYEVVKQSQDAGREELCPVHLAAMQRVWSAPFVSTLGAKDFKRDGDRELVCVGNEKVKPKNNLSSYDLPREVMAKFEG